MSQLSAISQQFVVFSIAEGEYAVPIQQVSEIIRMQAVTRIPHTEQALLGMIRLREQVVPLVSLHRVFDESEPSLTERTRMIILHHQASCVAVVVDAVDQVSVLPESRISPPPTFSRNEWLKGVYHHDGGMVALLDMEAVLAGLELSDELT